MNLRVGSEQSGTEKRTPHRHKLPRVSRERKQKREISMSDESYLVSYLFCGKYCKGLFKYYVRMRGSWWFGRNLTTRWQPRETSKEVPDKGFGRFGLPDIRILCNT